MVTVLGTVTSKINYRSQRLEICEEAPTIKNDLQIRISGKEYVANLLRTRKHDSLATALHYSYGRTSSCHFNS